jgi:hypothetical protein
MFERRVGALLSTVKGDDGAGRSGREVTLADLAVQASRNVSAAARR